MPASSFDSFHVQESRNNFDVMRPAPICTDANQFMGQCQNIHISTNCYYGYHDAKTVETSKMNDMSIDCEMEEPPHVTSGSASPQVNTRKRSADNADYPQTKRLREEVQNEKNIEPETTEKLRSDASSEDLLESLYWHIHGGNIFQLLQYS